MIESEPVSRQRLLQRVKAAIREVEPGASILLYGSHSRGDATPDSDWDFLVLVDGPVGESRKDAIRHRLYEVEWDSGEVISTVICSREAWNSRRYMATPFHQHVAREGVLL